MFGLNPRTDLEFVAVTGQAERDVTQLGTVYTRTTLRMTDAALKQTIAQGKLTAAVERHGPQSRAAMQAELAYRNATRETTTALNREGQAVNRLEHDVSGLTRGALIGSGAARGLARAYAFGSTALLGGAGAIYALRSFTKAAREHMVIEGQLSRTVRNQGINYRGYSSEIQGALKQQRELTGFTEDDTITAFEKFVRVTGDVGLALKATAIAGDVARGSGQGLDAISTKLVRGYLGQARGLAGLQIEVAKGSKGWTVLEAANKQYHDSAQNFANTEAGSEARRNIAIHETEILIGRGLLPSYQQLNTKIADWLDKSGNQKRIQHDVNRAIEDGTKIVHGLVNAEKLIAPPIHHVIDALGGLEHAVELALVIGLANKAKRGAGSIGLIRAASARARTGIVADAAVEERALAGVATQAARTGTVVAGISPLTRRVGAYTGVGYQSVAGGAAKGTAGLLRRAASSQNAALALLFGAGYLPQGGASNNIQGAAGAAFAGSLLTTGPAGAVIGGSLYETAKGGQALSNYLGSTTFGQTLGIGDQGVSQADLAKLAQSAAGGQLSQDQLDKIKFFLPATAYTALSKIIAAQPSLFGTNPFDFSRKGRKGIHVPGSASGSYQDPSHLSAAQKRAIDLAEHPNSLSALGEQATYDRNAIAFLNKRFADHKIVGGSKEYVSQLAALENDLQAQQSSISSIEQAAASKRRAAAAKIAAARRKAAAALKAAAAKAQHAYDARVASQLQELRNAAHGGKRSRLTTLPGDNPGLVKGGNIDINNRKVAHNPDGSISTVRTISIQTDGVKGEILIPTVVNGKVVSEKDAIAHYMKTGQQLGIFKNSAAANAYGVRLHDQQANLYGSPHQNQGEHRLTSFLEKESHDAKLSRLQRARFRADLIRERKAEATDAAKAAAAETKRLRTLRATTEQNLQNAVLRAQLLTGPAELTAERKADLALVNFYKAREKDAGATKADIQAAKRKELEARLALKKLTAAPAASAAAFFAEAANEYGTYGSNIGRPGAVLSPQDARGNLGMISELQQLRKELRENTRHAKATAAGTTVLAAGSRISPSIFEAREAAFHGY